MVQGKTKGLQRKGSSSSARHAARAAAAPKKGKRYIAPKKTALIKQALVHKQLSVKSNNSIERQTVDAASSEKLTIMKHSTSRPTSSSSGVRKEKS